MAEERPEAEPKSILKLDLSTAINQLLKALSRLWARLLSSQVVTLDISRTHIRLMEAKNGVARRWADISYDPREIDPETAEGERALGAMVKQLMTSSGIRAKSVVASVDGLYTVSRIIPVANLPPAPTLEESVNEIAPEVMPVSAESIYFFWQSLNTGEDEQQVFAVGVPRIVIDTKIRAMKHAGITPSVLELKTMALSRAVNRERAIILNIEPASLDIVIVMQGVPEVMHSLAWQYDDLSGEDAVEYLATNLEMTVDFYNAHHVKLPFDVDNPLFITGQLSAEPDLVERLQQRLAYKVEQLLPPLTCPPFLPVSQYAVNIGLAQRVEATLQGSSQETGMLSFDVNLLPDAYRPWHPTAKQVYSAVVLVLAVALTFPLVQITTEEMNKTRNLELKNTTLQNQLTLKMAEIKNREPLQKAISEYDSLIKRGGSFSEDVKVILSEAERIGVDISSIAHTGKDIGIVCQAEDYIDFRLYMNALADSGRFATPIPPPEGYPYIKGGSIKLKTQTGG